MITVENYSLTLGSFRLKHVDVSVMDHEIFAILGRTGSGKTVLLESMAGFHHPEEGVVCYDKTDVEEIPLERRRIGFVYQDYSLFPHMKVKDNIQFGLKMHKVPKRECHRISEEMMEKLGISHLKNRHPNTLSGGEKQRVSIARALVLKPEILFMDEPFSALDPNTKVKMYELMKDIHRELNCTIVFVTHDFHEARRLADRVAVMIDGEIREICEVDNLFQNHADPQVNEFLGIQSETSQPYSVSGLPE